MAGRDVQRSFFIPLDQRLTVEKTEPVNCNLCGSAAFKTLAWEYEFEIRTCRDCGLVYVSPQPTAEELPRFYDAFYADTSEEAANERTLGWVEPHIARLIKRRCPEGGRLFEVGCGFGALLESLQDQPFDLHALELSEAAAAFARKRVPNAAIQHTSLESAEVGPSSMDCVVAIAVLEHMKDPRAALARMATWLRPGGVLVINVPYVQHFMRLKRWLPFLPLRFEAPRHLFDFAPKNLARYCTGLGFVELRFDVARPFVSRNALQTAMLWGLKVPAIALNALTGHGWVWPYSAAYVMTARKPPRE